MVTKYEIKSFIKKHQDGLSIKYNEEDDQIYLLDGKHLCSLDEYVTLFRKNTGQLFESIYYSKISLLDVLKCMECGTVIFSYYDERYDHNLKCPVCTKYNTYFEYWTKDDIENDSEKQKAIKGMEYEMKCEEECYDRMMKRGGLYDWQIYKKKIYGKKHCLIITLECDNITESYFKGLRIDVQYGKKDDNGFGYLINRFFKIPLSISQIKLYYYIWKHRKEEDNGNL